MNMLASRDVTLAGNNFELTTKRLPDGGVQADDGGHDTVDVKMAAANAGLAAWRRGGVRRNVGHRLVEAVV
ncbi:MAG TPA: hypothetical protein VFO20_11590 [Propionibacteriaceae bacterium]|nr:hypothetical protein [Propionibacteriaceae bacterium]